MWSAFDLALWDHTKGYEESNETRWKSVAVKTAES